MKRHILVVDDEPEIRRAVRAALRAEGYEVDTLERGEPALEFVEHYQPDLVVLDLSLPSMSGYEVCRRLRQWSEVPIIILSVHDTEQDKVEALDQGADDYLVKPFGIGELLARVRAALRRARNEVEMPVVEVDGLKVDVAAHQVWLRGSLLRLTPKEFDLLAFLISHRGRVVTHQVLLRHVWGPEYGSEVQYLRVFVSQLRRKLEVDPHNPRFLLTENGVGYRFPNLDSVFDI